MAVTVNIYYSGENGNARKFAEEMVSSGVADDIRAEAGNIRYADFPKGSENTQSSRTFDTVMEFWKRFFSEVRI